MDWYGGIALSALLFYPLGDSPMKRKARKFYQSIRLETKIPILPPGAVFGPVWFFLYLLIATAIVLWNHDANQSHWTWLAIWITALVNFLLNKLWTLLFFGLNMVRVAAVDAALLLLTGAFVLILLCLPDVEDQFKPIGNGSSYEELAYHYTDRRIIAIAFWSAYVLWLLFAMILSIWIAVKLPVRSAPAKTYQLVSQN